MTRAFASGVVAVESEAALDALIGFLLDLQRRQPVVVVTVPSGRERPHIDAEAVAREAGRGAAVYVVGTGPLTFRMADALTPMACVYGGAGRLYPPGDAWLHDPYQSTLRFARDAAEGAEATEELIGDVLAAVATSFGGGSAADLPARRVTGRISAVVPPTRALVALEDGEVATIWAELVVPGVPVGRLLTAGMDVTGDLDGGTRRLDVAGMRVPTDAALSGYEPGAVVLARVVRVQPDRVDVELHPGATAAIAAAEVTADERDDLTELLSPGETVTVRVIQQPSPARSGWRLAMVDVDDDEPVLTAPPVLRGGPPWLTRADPAASPEPVDPGAGPPEVAESPDVTAPPVVAASPPVVGEPTALSTPAALPPTADPGADVAALRRQVEDLSEENALLEAERREHLTKIDALRTEIERLRTRVREAKSKERHAAAVPDTSAGFADPVDQLRWDIERTWVERVPAAEKPHLPLAEYTVGPRFVDSLDRIEGIRRDRVLQVVVSVLVGRLPADTHPLRRTVGADDRPVTRDGAVCLRAPLQTGTPSARRLHYWKGPGEHIELSRVVVHDDFDP